MEIDQFITALDSDGALLADAAQAAGLDTDVPGCPGWRVRDLVRHQAYIHRWAMRHILERPAEVIDDNHTEADILGGGSPEQEPEEEPLAAYREGHAALVRALRTADPDLKCATFMPAPSPLAFWSRRQAHETAIHRYDAQRAAGTVNPGSTGDPGSPGDPVGAFAPDFAADGIDELIMGFAARGKYRMRDEGHSLAVRPGDAAGGWRIAVRDGVTEVRRDLAGDLPARCVLRGPAAGLYTFLWNRCDRAEAGLTVQGEESVLATWRSGVRVRWD
ncbi:MAG: maleylpyruvate isomerase N-terminal domain-containing protein [Nocardiopsaceae bacterium]|nr:maleylpyruvate isomerase N-terminal domain-containing protein [Nocardiopsaceae bacterium]